MLGFTIVFSGFMLLWVDWHRVLLCGTKHGSVSEDNCQALTQYILGSSQVFAGTRRLLVVCMLVVFSTYWLWSFLSLVPALQEAWLMRKFYREALGVCTRDMQTMPW
jgi:hypothetical protein